LTADCLNFVFSRSADYWGWGSFEERLGDGHTSGFPARFQLFERPDHLRLGVIAPRHKLPFRK
jgi:hypothetical protein